MNGVILIISLRRTNLTDLSDRRTRAVVADDINALNRVNRRVSGRVVISLPGRPRFDSRVNN